MNTSEASAIVYADKIADLLGGYNGRQVWRTWTDIGVSKLIRLLKIIKAARRDRVLCLVLEAARVSWRYVWMLERGCKPGMVPIVWPELRAAMYEAGLEILSLPSYSVLEARGSDIVETVTSIATDTITHKSHSPGFRDIVADLAPAAEIVTNGGRGTTTITLGKRKPVRVGTPEFSKLVSQIVAGKFNGKR